MSLPLSGVTVLDLTRVLAGPYATMVLGDLGADVIKVERLPGGDDSRAMGPFRDGESYCFAQVNRNKRSAALDVKHPQGLKALLALAARSDVVVENFRPGTAERLGCGYDAVRAVRPDIIYCPISGEGGQCIDTSLVESGIAWTAWAAAAYFGGGEVALACDIRLASPRAGFAIPAVRHGIVYDRPTVTRLVELMGSGRAGHLLFTAGRIDAGRAAETGLVDILTDDPGAELAGFPEALRAADLPALPAIRDTIRQVR